MLWQEINGTLHLVFDSQIICRVQVHQTCTICTTCLEMYQVSALQLSFLWQKKQDQTMTPETPSIEEPFLNVSSVDKKTFLLESPSTTVSLEEWVEQRKKKSMTPQTFSYSVEAALQDAMGG